MMCRVLRSHLSGSMSGFRAYPTLHWLIESVAWLLLVGFVGFPGGERLPDNSGWLFDSHSGHEYTSMGVE